MIIAMQLRLHRSLTSWTTHIARPGSAVIKLWYHLNNLQTPSYPTLPDDIATHIAPRDDEFKHLSFTFAVIALSAHVACLGGLTREKYVAFRDAFPLSGSICGKVRKLFTLACRNEAPFEHYVTQIKHIFPGRTPLFASLVERLFSIAIADGRLSRQEEHTLARIAHMLGLSATEYATIRDKYLHPQAHHVLGLSKRTPMHRLKTRYHALMRRYHPDHLAAHERSPEIEMLLQLKSSEINRAYRALSKRAA